jgi:outer membrane protein OmpA-like peptidoglycan-associated protein
MRTQTCLILAATALAASVLPLRDTAAQVTTDPRALDTLRPPTPAARPAPVPPAKPTPPSSGTTIRPNAAPVAPVPAAAPPGPVVPPPLVVPTRPAAPVIPATVSPDAPGLASPLPGGVRVTFGPGRTDLNPSTEATIRALVKGGPGMTPAAVNASFTVTAFAAGTPDDPSTSRRVSLSRALGVRSVLISQGIESVRIYVRAQGPTSPAFADGPADRVDLVVGPPVLPQAAATSATGPKKTP